MRSPRILSALRVSAVRAHPPQPSTPIRVTLITMRPLLLLALCSFAHAQAPTAPVISARGVTNFFTQDPAPGTVAQGALVRIAGLNLGPADGATAPAPPWPTRLGGTQVVIGGKPAPL